MKKEKVNLKEDKKRKRMIFLLVIVCLLTISASDLIMSMTSEEKVAKTRIMMEEIMSPQKKYDGIDVLAIGNSDMYSGFDPQILWDVEGIPSYVAAGPNTHLYISYCMLEGILRTQHPQVIVLEVDEFFEKKEKYRLDQSSQIAYENCYGFFSTQGSYLNCPMIHQYRATQSRIIKNKGYENISATVPYYGGFSYMKESNQRQQPNWFVKEYLSDFMALAKKYNCEVLFICMPSASSWNYKKHNTVNDYAKKYAVPFIDFNVNQFDTDFNWLTDSRDGGNHLNRSGAKKISSFLAQYLKDNYQLVNHKNNDLYSHWQE